MRTAICVLAMATGCAAPTFSGEYSASLSSPIELAIDRKMSDVFVSVVEDGPDNDTGTFTDYVKQNVVLIRYRRQPMVSGGDRYVEVKLQDGDDCRAAIDSVDNFLVKFSGCATGNMYVWMP